MANNPVQPNIEITKSHIPYREAKGTIKTDKNVKPVIYSLGENTLD